MPDEHPTPPTLLDVARASRTSSYAPYSKFKAGAAVATESGAVFAGVIVENVSLGLAMCAERVAMFSAVAAGEQVRRLALVAPATGDALTWPCGACLQVALELGGPAMLVEVGDVDDTTATSSTVGDLLPNGPHVSG